MSELVAKPIAVAEVVGFARSSTHPTKLGFLLCCKSPVIASEAKQSRNLTAEAVWIASALMRLAMTRGEVANKFTDQDTRKTREPPCCRLKE
jgi:hypothetical protein